MKKPVYLVITFALLCLMEGGVLAQSARVSTGSGALNMRRKAEAGATVLERIPNGEGVEIIGQEGEWSRIAYKGKEGYVKSQFLSTVSEGEADASGQAEKGPEQALDQALERAPQHTPAPIQTGGTAWIQTGNGALNLRKKADAKSIVVTRVPDGERVQVEAAMQEWSRIAYQGKSGYVKTEYLRLDSQMIGKEIYPDGAYLYVRAEEDDQSEILASVHAAQPMTILEIGEQTVRVSVSSPYYEGIQGYIRLQDIADWKEAPAQSQPYYAHLTLSADEIVLGDVLDVTLQHAEDAQCRLNLYRDSEAVLEDWPVAYDSASYRPKERGAYRLEMIVKNAQGDELIRCEQRFLVSGDAPATDDTVLYSQKDGWWLDKKYGRSNLDQSGCAIFTLSAALRLLGFGDEATGAQLLAQTYPMYLTESGTVTENLLAGVSRDFGYTAGKEKITKAEEIVQCFDEGAVFSFSVASGHIALAAGMSEDGSKVRILDSAPGATFERIENASLYVQGSEGEFCAVESLWEIPGAKYYFETDDFGGLEYYLDLDYVAKRGVRMIARRK